MRSGWENWRKALELFGWNEVQTKRAALDPDALRRFIDAEAFHVATYPGDPDDLVVHAAHLARFVDRFGPPGIDVSVHVKAGKSFQGQALRSPVANRVEG